MSLDIPGLLDLWSSEPVPGQDPAEPFRAWYADPVRVNGVDTTAAQLAARAADVRARFGAPQREVVAVSDAGDEVTVVFELRSATETLRVIDLLRLDHGRIAEIWVVAQELDR
jgi:hypothetical protein